MPQETTVVTARAGAKSCVECRRRKIRCIWPTTANAPGEDGSRACSYCLTRGKTCVQQVQRPRVRGADRNRIASLERDVAALAALVRDRHVPDSSPTSSSDNHDVASLLDDLVYKLDYSDIEGASPPSHLRLLFKELAIELQDDGDNDDNEEEGDEDEVGDKHKSTTTAASVQAARVNLQTLLPSYDEIVHISAYATEWMTLHYSLIPSAFAVQTGEQIVTDHARMRNKDVHPVVLAMYLLTVAITVQQVPQSSMPMSFKWGQSVTRYIDVVCRAVDQTVLANNALLATTEGLETAMLFVRLLLGRSDHKITWLSFRRVLAVAELVGLPQANDAMSRITETQSTTEKLPTSQASLRAKADVWEAICTTDRSMSMMLNLPPGTTRYRFPRNQSVWRGEEFCVRTYYHRLSNVSAMTFEIDESYVRGISQAESYEKVLHADRELRTLAASAPPNWWHDIEGLSLDHRLTKFWHCYILARVHLRPAMMSDLDKQYAFSRSACYDACKEAALRFLQVRLLVPSGFYVCRVLDLQAFAAATFLVLSSGLGQRGNQLTELESGLDPSTTQLVERVIDCFERVSDQAGADLACEAKIALGALLSSVQGNPNGPQRFAPLQIPLLGKVLFKQPRGSVSSIPLSNIPTPVHSDSSSNHRIDTGQSEASSSAHANIPALWSFEFDDPLLWMETDQLISNMGPVDYTNLDHEYSF